MAALDKTLRKPIVQKRSKSLASRSAAKRYGVDIAQVQEINRMVTVTHVPQAAPFMEGVIKLARASAWSALNAQEHPHRRHRNQQRLLRPT